MGQFALVTRRQFDTYEQAMDHLKFYDPSHQIHCKILECPHGVTYPEPKPVTIEDVRRIVSDMTTDMMEEDAINTLVTCAIEAHTDEFNHEG